MVSCHPVWHLQDAILSSKIDRPKIIIYNKCILYIVSRVGRVRGTLTIDPEDVRSNPNRVLGPHLSCGFFVKFSYHTLLKKILEKMD